MNNSVILQVDESTKGLMEEIQSGISSSIEDGMREVKDKVESVDGTAEMILRKFKNFDSLSITVEQLRSLAEESKKFSSVVSPLESSVSELKQGSKTLEEALSHVKSNIDLLVKGVVELNEKEANSSSKLKSEIQKVLESINYGNENTSTLLNDILQKMSQAENERKGFFSELNASISSINTNIGLLSQSLNEKASKIETNIHEVEKLHKVLANRYSENEAAHQDFASKTNSQIDEIKKVLEKNQATLDIIVNLSTPFWKKW